MSKVQFETKPCIRCEKTTILELDEARFHLWQDGAFVQVAFPDLSADDRELLITGTHPACWNALFPPDEDDD